MLYIKYSNCARVKKNTGCTLKTLLLNNEGLPPPSDLVALGYTLSALWASFQMEKIYFPLINDVAL
jgi:hypothetical protein